ncbi:unnamed protein product [Sphenostylis stenocarpa]|uniref:Uncharacterized protein n=1 Tax=Sphenostylis stenocarpa TaxID=92480 RepID=A0AA86VPH1_9FABA|nr:unnamed protein product [Sphenostylis stenocarpa]
MGLEAVARVFPKLNEMDNTKAIRALQGFLAIIASLVAHAEKKVMESNVNTKERWRLELSVERELHKALYQSHRAEVGYMEERINILAKENNDLEHSKDKILIFYGPL